MLLYATLMNNLWFYIRGSRKASPHRWSNG